VSQVASQSENGSDGQSVKLKLDVIDVAPSPIFARFERLHDGMFRRMEMFGGVFVLRGIAATHMAADHTQPQVDPGVVHFQALFAAVRARLHILNLVDVRTGHDSASHDRGLIFPMEFRCEDLRQFGVVLIPPSAPEYDAPLSDIRWRVDHPVEGIVWGEAGVPQFRNLDSVKRFPGSK
jgi:hypothetical protein